MSNAPYRTPNFMNTRCKEWALRILYQQWRLSKSLTLLIPLALIPLFTFAPESQKLTRHMRIISRIRHKNMLTLHCDTLKSAYFLRLFRGGSGTQHFPALRYRTRKCCAQFILRNTHFIAVYALSSFNPMAKTRSPQTRGVDLTASYSLHALAPLTSLRPSAAKINAIGQFETNYHPRLRRINRWRLYFNEWSGTVINT